MRRFSWSRTQIRVARSTLPSLIAVFVAMSGAAQAEFVLSPLRQVITVETPKVTYEISNPSPRTLETQISWVDLKAVETGYVPADPALRENISAAPYLIVSPTFLRLEPGARETITVALRGAQPPKGERRSHLLIASKAVRTLLRKAGSGIQLDLDAAISTPVILRGSSAETRARIGVTRLLRNPDGALDLETMIRPHGAFSAYGYIAAFFTAKNTNEEIEIARLENVAAYPEAETRKMIIPLKTKQFEAGVLRVRYIGAAEYDGVQFDERAFEVSPPE